MKLPLAFQHVEAGWGMTTLSFLSFLHFIVLAQSNFDQFMTQFVSMIQCKVPSF